MSPGIVALVLTAAVIHVTWNLLLKSASDPLRFAAVANTIGAGVMVPMATVVWWLMGADHIAGEAFVLACVAGVLEVGYFSFLTAAYKRGDISVVYPIARGTAPLLSVLIGVIILGERLGWGGSLGVAALLSGVLAIRRPWLLFRRSARETNPRVAEAAALAFATGAMIASYSAVDREGARATEPWIYAAILSVTVMIGLWLRVAIGARLRAASPVEMFASGTTERAAPPVSMPRDPLFVAGAVGVLSYVGYGLILFAYNHAPLTAVAPLRESAVVFASGWGTLRLREGGSHREVAWRLGGATLVVVGICMLAVDGG